MFYPSYFTLLNYKVLKGIYPLCQFVLYCHTTFYNNLSEKRGEEKERAFHNITSLLFKKLYNPTFQQVYPKQTKNMHQTSPTYQKLFNLQLKSLVANIRQQLSWPSTPPFWRKIKDNLHRSFHLKSLFL